MLNKNFLCNEIIVDDIMGNRITDPIFKVNLVLTISLQLSNSLALDKLKLLTPIYILATQL